YKEAGLNCFQFAVQLDPENQDALALICMHYTNAGKTDLAIPFGQRSLEARDRQAGSAAEPVRASRPKPFDPSTPERNIISFSLFGENPYYWRSAIANAAMAYAIFPEWRCRFYCDRNVPEGVRENLLVLKSQIYVGDNSKNWDGLFWRFQSFDDPNVDVVMVR